MTDSNPHQPSDQPSNAGRPPESGRPDVPNRPTDSGPPRGSDRPRDPGQRNRRGRQRDDRRRTNPERKPHFSRQPRLDQYQSRPSSRPTPPTFQRRVWDIVESAHTNDTSSRLFHWALFTLIVLNVIAVMLGSIANLDAQWGTALAYFRRISIAAFTVEYLVRLWACVSDGRYTGTIRGRVRYALSPLALTDLLAILPAYVTGMRIDLRMLRAFRLMRIFRLMRSGRYAQAPTMLLRVVRSRREELACTLAFLTVLLLVAATLVFFFEHSTQPNQFPSIPTALWWSVLTLTTVGLGGAVPITVLGKVVGGVVAVMGPVLFAVLAGILAAGFVDEHKHRREPISHAKCPRCGYRP